MIIIMMIVNEREEKKGVEGGLVKKKRKIVALHEDSLGQTYKFDSLYSSALVGGMKRKNVKRER
jgi:hypothetical protein